MLLTCITYTESIRAGVFCMFMWNAHTYWLCLSWNSVGDIWLCLCESITIEQSAKEQTRDKPVCV